MEKKSKQYYGKFTDIVKDHKTNKKYNKYKIDRLTDLLNEQDEKIKELENMNSRLSQGIYWGNGEQFCDVVKQLKQENQQLTKLYDQLNKRYCEEMDKNIILKQSQNSKAIEVLKDIIQTCNSAKVFCGNKATASDITSAISYNQAIDDVEIMINNQITELEKSKESMP